MGNQAALTVEPVPGSRLVTLFKKLFIDNGLRKLPRSETAFVAPGCDTFLVNVEHSMANLTGLFRRGGSYYIRIVLPLQHPLKHKYRNGRMVQTLGACGHREAVLRGTVKRAEVLSGWSGAVAAPMPQAIEVTPANLTTLRDVYGKWAVSKPRSSDSKAACTRSVALFEAFTENTPLVQLSRAQGDTFRTWLQQPERKTTSKTARDRLNWVKSLLKFAFRDLELLPRNPWEGMEIEFKTTHKRRPWTDGELNTLLSQPLHTAYVLPKDKKAGRAAAYWLPLLALYTGARVGELAQLTVADIVNIGDIPVLSITDEGEYQLVKTSAGIRKVPIHSALVRLGFLDYVANLRCIGVNRLWQDLPSRQGRPGGYFSHWFGIYRHTLGLGRFPDFHCFRHTVRSQLAEAGVPEQVIDCLVGHEVQGSTGAKVYTHRSMKTLKEAIEVLGYGAVAQVPINTQCAQDHSH